MNFLKKIPGVLCALAVSASAFGQASYVGNFSGQLSGSVTGAVFATDGNVLTNANPGNGATGVILGDPSNAVIQKGAFGPPLDPSIFGGTQNTILGNYGGAAYAIIVGGNGNSLYQALGGFIGGGYGNVMTNLGANFPDYGVIAGGQNNTVQGEFASIVGGQQNLAQGQYSFIAGGQNNTVSGIGPLGYFSGGTVPAGSASSILGGLLNYCPGVYSVIVGGGVNTNLGQTSVIFGDTCLIGTNNGWCSILGGFANTIANNTNPPGDGYVETYDTIVGGWQNTIGGGDYGGAIIGGQYNSVGAPLGTVIGGQHNAANGNNSFVAGEYGTASFANSFVWSDTQAGGETDTSTNQFRASAHGGFYFDNGPANVAGAVVLSAVASCPPYVTNGLSAMWNSNGIHTWLRTSTVGATNFTDTLLH